MNRRPPPKSVKCLLPVWGHRYTRQFLEVGLPTLLTPGNVPALAVALPCEFVVATANEDAATILEHPNWRLLSDICPTRLVPIDDLISDASHATSLTLAYARIIRSTGVDMPDCCFLFLVADFVLADGSLRAVLERLKGGASGVLAGNFQVAAEEMAPLLPRSGSLTPRELVHLSLAHLHPDTSHAVVNGAFCQHPAINRLFWRVDAETMLGRFYLAHMIGIRPEVSDFIIGSSADYSFIPELCPSGDVEIITDSDEYFAVEMQPPASDTSAPGAPLDTHRLAADLSRWTTARHRANAEATIVFHVGEIPATMATVAAQADGTIRDIAQALSPASLPHRDHPYWIGGLALHNATAGQKLEDELGYRPADRPSTIAALLWRLRLGAFGRPPSVRPWHPRAPDFALARRALKSAIGRALVIASEPRTFARWLRPAAGSVTALSAEHVLDGALQTSAEGFDACLLVLPWDKLTSSTALVAKITPWLKPDGRIAILVTGEPAEDVSFFSPPATADAVHALGIGGWRIDVGYVNAGRVRRAVQRRLNRLTHAAYRSRLALLPLHAAAWAALAAASYLCNLAAVRPSPSGQAWCSGILLVLCRAAPATDRAGIPLRRPPTGLMALCAIS